MNKWMIYGLGFLFSYTSSPLLAYERIDKEGIAEIEKKVAACLEAIRKKDWRRYADLLHPDSLNDYKKMWQPWITAISKKEKVQQQKETMELFGTDFQTLSRLNPKEFFENSMKILDLLRFPPSQIGLVQLDEKIIGTVKEGDDIAHVMVRVKTKSAVVSMTKMEVYTLKRSGGEWKIILSEVVNLLADMLTRTPQSETIEAAPELLESDPMK